MKKLIIILAMVALVTANSCVRESFEPPDAMFRIECSIEPFDTDRYTIDQFVGKVIVYSPDGEYEHEFAVPIGEDMVLNEGQAEEWLGWDMAVFVIFRVHDRNNPSKAVPTSVSPHPQWTKFQKINKITRFEGFIGKP